MLSFYLKFLADVGKYSLVIYLNKYKKLLFSEIIPEGIKKYPCSRVIETDKLKFENIPILFSV